MWITRYILFRLGEEWGLDVVLDPKPVKGQWNGNGCHTNFLTKATRDPKIGWKTLIEDHLVKLKEKHMEQIFVYGKGNKFRMLGTHETAHYDVFSYGIGSRECYVRVPVGTAETKCGYFEDRRPASNI